jgi:hypothetical protein
MGCFDFGETGPFYPIADLSFSGANTSRGDSNLLCRGETDPGWLFSIEGRARSEFFDLATTSTV